MTPIAQTPQITQVKFDDGFTGDAKIFVRVEKAADQSEQLVIYEKSGIAAFFTDIFRDRSNTFTLREWAHRKLGDLPETINKGQLTANIKQLVSPYYIASAPEILNKLISERKLDGNDMVESKTVRFDPRDAAAFASELQTKFEKLSDAVGKTSASDNGKRYFALKQMVVKSNSPLSGITTQQGVFAVMKGIGGNMPATGLKDHPKIKEIVALFINNEELKGKSYQELTELKLLTGILLSLEKRQESAPNTRYVGTLKLIATRLDAEIDVRMKAKFQT